EAGGGGGAALRGAAGDFSRDFIHRGGAFRRSVGRSSAVFVHAIGDCGAGRGWSAGGVQQEPGREGETPGPSSRRSVSDLFSQASSGKSGDRADARQGEPG